MKDNEIKKVFYKIKLNDSMKSRILENVYNELNTNGKSQKNKLNVVYLKHRKSLTTLAASLVLIFGLFLYNENKLNNLQNLSRSSESLNKSVSRSRGNIKDNEFDINILKDNTVKVKIKNDKNGKIFKEITDKKSIKNLLELLQESKEKDLNSQNYNDFKNTGKIITLSFVTKDNLISYIKINLDSNKENVDLSKVKDIAIRGLIKSIRVDKEVTSIKVEGNLEKDTRYDIANILVDKDTIINKGDSNSNLKISDLKIGQKIEVVFQGPEGRSYPVTANAYSINIINE
ncbi:Uncharacterised protein [[Clostridium] sordellii]|uniref:DUF3221 domain-containing protein n=1 Tax=Paraclostridium sordellii TaxID=1505 RepID=UPI0005DA8EAD|nr:DUF3221 domain-containing protein [Paeniclostridium sordellii]CEO05363.1 Uncharacterised protein [[Clostridium] sordellii] [Paeniclostridium sordellii]